MIPITKTPEYRRLTKEFIQNSGFLSAEEYIASGLPMPHGTVVEDIQTSGGDRTSFSDWESNIPANPTEAYTGQLNEAMDGGAVTMNVSNSSAVDLTLTVVAAYRFYNQTGWPNCAAVEGLGGRIESAGGVNVVDILVDNVVVEWLDLSSTDSPIVRTGTASITGTARNCIIRDTPTTTGAIISAAGTLLVHNCFIYSCLRGARVNGATLNMYNCTVFDCSAIGIYRQAGTLNAYNCISVGNAKDFSGTIGGNYNISSDATAPGANSFTNETASTILEDVGAGTEDLHWKSTTDREDYPGGSYGYTTDIDNETVTDGYIGADGAVASGPAPSAPQPANIIRHTSTAEITPA